MNTYIIVTFQFEATHCWPGCPHEDVAFLRYPHRHVFHVRAEARVGHLDRDIEIIRFKRELAEYAATRWGQAPAPQSTSCEMMAAELLKKFNLHRVEVLEDGENGAAVEE